jgi:hypothetical protein
MWPVDRLSHRLSVAPDSSHFHAFGSDGTCNKLSSALECVGFKVAALAYAHLQHSMQIMSCSASEVVTSSIDR